MFHKATEACFPMIFTHTKENLAPKGGRNNIFTFFPSPEWVFEIYFGFRVESGEPSNPKCGLVVRATNRRVPLFWYSGLLTLIFVSYVIRIRKHLTPTHKYQAIYIYIEFHYGKSPSRFPLFLGARASIHHACTCDVWKSLTPHRPSVPIRILIPILIPPPALRFSCHFPGVSVCPEADGIKEIYEYMILHVRCPRCHLDSLRYIFILAPTHDPRFIHTRIRTGTCVYLRTHLMAH